MASSLKFRWPLPPPHPAAFNSYSPPPTARYIGCTGGIAGHKRGKRLRKQFKAELQEKKEEEKEEFRVVTAVQSQYNHIVILDTSKSRLLLLDSTHNVHSMLNKETKWTASYWDEFAALPPVVPRGPIAIFGLGGGTTAHLLLDLWPSLQLEGWEIDGIVITLILLLLCLYSIRHLSPYTSSENMVTFCLIDISRDYFGLSDLEKQTVDGGGLNIHIGDVFSPAAAISGGYAGIIVDLFAEGKVLPQLEQAATWLKIYNKLMPDGRIMVNCGAGEGRLPAANAGSEHDGSSMDGSWKLNATIRALCEAFPGQVNWKKMPQSAGENYLALTGSLPDPTTWSAALPYELSSSVNLWRNCNIHDN